MKINTKLISGALKDLSPLAKSRSSNVFSGLVKIETHDRMKLSCSDGDQFMTREIEFSGEIATIALNLNQFLYSLGEAEETTILQETGCIIVKCGQKVSRLQTMDAAEFPAMPELSNFNAIGLNCMDIASGIRCVHGFEHKEDARGAISCLHASGGPAFIECVATDGGALARWRGALISADFDLVIPSAFCDALATALEAENAQLAASGNGLLVTHASGSLFCKLSEHVYPSIMANLGSEEKLLGTMETKALIREATSCAMFCDPAKVPKIDLEFTSKGLDTSFAGLNSALNNTFEGDFKPYKASVNITQLLKCLNALGGRCEVYGGDKLVFKSGWTTVYLGLLRG